MRRHHEAQEQGHENQGPRQQVAQSDHAGGAQQDDADHANDRQQGAEGVHLRGGHLPYGVVEHDEAARHRAEQHLHGREKGVEALHVEHGQIRHAIRCHRTLQEAPGIVVVAVAQLRQQADQEQDGEGPAQCLLALPRERREGKGQHCGSECQCPQEPSGCVPDLGVHGEPCLRHGQGHGPMAERSGPSAEQDVGVQEHRHEQDTHQEVEREVSEDTLQDPLRLGGAQELGGGFPLLILRCGVGGHVSAECEEGAHDNVDLGHGLEGELRRFNEGYEVTADDVGDQKKTHGVERGDADLLCRLLGCRRLACLCGSRGAAGIPQSDAAGSPQAIHPCCCRHEGCA
mmetsp:Transcript_88953/g.251041  ORF Transcript_88953/g.251041 Transcript_88953/m.251041 type:complete len:344 (-) Transcript_88953:268-1299(-)